MFKTISLLLMIVALGLVLPRSIRCAENLTDSVNETFNRYRVSVEPLLKKHCFQCHGDEDEVRGEDSLQKRFVLFLKARIWMHF